jgi:1-aminocyclopropane-1-carboxylate deaminase
MNTRLFDWNKSLHHEDSHPLLFEHQKVSVVIRNLFPQLGIVGGNKWYKLKYNFRKAVDEDYPGVITFGGAFSNHLAATARAGKLAGIKTAAVVRGEKESSSNITLSRAADDGMRLVFVDRTAYRNKNQPGFIGEHAQEFKDYLVIPEGGANWEGVKGSMEIIQDDHETFDHIILACGTGTTAAGIIMSMKPHQRLTGISVLKDEGFLESSILHWLDKFHFNSRSGTWEINHDYAFGGYAKTSKELNDFCSAFHKKTGIGIEPVYTGKMFFALEDLIRKNYFTEGSRILALHTGGMGYLGKDNE